MKINSINMDDYLNLINNHLNSSEIKYIIEVGSLDGKDSMFFKTHFPDANVYAIEGLPENYMKYLKNNNMINSYNIVICDYIGYVKFYVKKINGIHGIFDRGNQYGDLILNLPCITLDKFCEDNEIPRIDVLKIDVEGATLNILMGMENILPKVKIMHIETETHEFFKNQTLHDDVVKFLTINNFTMLSITQCEILSNEYQQDSVWINNIIKK